MGDRSGTVKIARVFDFPRDLVFKMWTDPAKVAKWWGPERGVVVVSVVDPRPGGVMRIDVRTPAGVIHSMTGSFTEIAYPDRLVFRSAAPNSGVSVSPWVALNTVTFEELGPKKTRLTVVVEVVEAPPGELQALKEGFKGGWGESLGKLQKALS